MIFWFQPGAVSIRLGPSAPELGCPCFWGSKPAVSDNQGERDQIMEIFRAGWKETILKGMGRHSRLQGDLGTLSINSGEHLAWKNKVIKGGLVSAYVWLLHVAVVMFWGWRGRWRLCWAGRIPGVSVLLSHCSASGIIKTNRMPKLKSEHMFLGVVGNTEVTVVSFCSEKT